MSVLPLTVCISIFGAAAAQQASTDGGTQGDWCAQRGGLCQSTNECDQITNVLSGFCGKAIVCCVPKCFVCEKWRSGVCTSDTALCAAKPGHQLTGLMCSVNSVCCVPTYPSPPPFVPSVDGGGGTVPPGGRCPWFDGDVSKHGHSWHHGGRGWVGYRSC
ncbi:hypothetical protein LSAT2_019286 [Lamellibrachia satsuma]|nr:hypothetical protein LSAT2_019286 [Lamellibrachia satsuma]